MTLYYRPQVLRDSGAIIPGYMYYVTCIIYTYYMNYTTIIIMIIIMVIIMIMIMIMMIRLIIIIIIIMIILMIILIMNDI